LRLKSFPTAAFIAGAPNLYVHTQALEREQAHRSCPDHLNLCQFFFLEPIANMVQVVRIEMFGIGIA
jgi:hypothetical protein